MSNCVNLFGSAANDSGSTGGIKHLVEMRAGKMSLKGHTVYPDNRKGLLYMYQSEDSLMHFCWRDRTSGVVEDDLIIVPDCEYVGVPQCKTGRVYLLKFKSSNRKFFFWLQEPRDDKDEDHCKRINEYLNNPAGNMLSSNAEDQILQSMLNLSQFQLMQLLRGGQLEGLSSLFGTTARPGTGGNVNTGNDLAITHRATVPNAGTASANKSTLHSAPNVESVDDSPIQLADLHKYFQGIPPANATTGRANLQSDDIPIAVTFDALGNATTAGSNYQSVDLPISLTFDSHSQGNKLSDQMHGRLPDVYGTREDKSSALESDQANHVVSQLSINRDAVAAAIQGNIQDCVKPSEEMLKSTVSCENTNNDKKNEHTKKDQKKDGNDEDMQVD